MPKQDPDSFPLVTGTVTPSQQTRKQHSSKSGGTQQKLLLENPEQMKIFHFLNKQIFDLQISLNKNK